MVADDGFTPAIDGLFENVQPLTERQKQMIAKSYTPELDAQMREQLLDNNAKIPLAVACSVIFFGESANLVRLPLGGTLIVVAGVLASRRMK